MTPHFGPNAVMIFPNSKREKAINNYSKDLIEHTEVDSLTFTAGNPFSFPMFSSLRYDTVHIQHEYNLLGWYGLPWTKILPWLRLWNKKIILTMHTVNKPKKFGFLRRCFYKTSNLFIRLFADIIIVHSEAFKKILIKDYNFNPKMIKVIRHGVKKVPKFNKKKVRKELGLTDKVYLIIGNFHKNHQPHIIVKQLNEIGKTLLIVWNSGAVNDRNRDRLIKYYGDTIIDSVIDGTYKNIEKIDLAKKKGWWKYFYASDLVLLPYVEGVGSGIFQDAMATRTPVVCSNTTYFREMLKGQTCGVIANSNDDFPRAIKYAMKNLQKMEKGCNIYAKEYSVKKIAKKHLEVYNGRVY
jgi:glycosyltransferase involved in cell wall biosynthesis